GEESQRIAGLVETLARIEKDGAPDGLAPFRDPRNPAFMGSGAARVAALAPAPLALVAVGQSDLFPAAIRVTTDSKDHFLFADEIDNPANLMSGATDLAFVTIFVFPLVMLALCFNLLANEREQGTLALTLACAKQPVQTLWGKLATRVMTLIVVMLLAVTGGVALFAGAAALATLAFGALLALIVVYGLFWAALAAAVDSLGRSSAFNALTLIGAFVLVTMIAPAAINSLAAFVHPAPSRMDMVLAARAATTDADKARDAALARYAAEHGDDKSMTRGGAKERTLRRLATQEAAFARVEDVIAAHDGELERQRALADGLAPLSPALLVWSGLADIAGSGERRYRDYLTRLAAFHAEWRDFFLSRARAEASLTLADYEALPRFSEPPDVQSIDLADSFAWIALPTLLFGFFAQYGFRRCKS
ncbi:MAG: DUF3526 domain-containing protein, partial [Methylocystis sp.]|nr:DUF3526 domain-containing protein [Methylocystis sp.]